MRENKSHFILLLTAMLLILALIVIFLYRADINREFYGEDVFRCIANKTTLYVQLGCSHCEDQEEIIGDYLYLFNTVDCFYNSTLCADRGIMHTPTWVFDNLYIEGVYGIGELKNITGC